MRKLLQKSINAGRSAAHKIRSAVHMAKSGYSSAKEARRLLASVRAKNEKLKTFVKSKISKLPFASKKEVSALRAKVAKLEKKGKKR